MPTPASRTPVRIARGTYANLAASLADLNEGEICFATDEEALYVKNGGSLVASGGTSVTTSDTAPSTPSDGDLWYDSVSGRLFIYYQDPSGSQWVDASPQGGGSAGITVSDSAPSTPSNGDLWYRSSDGRLYVYYDDGSTSQWVDAAPQGGGGSGTSITAGNTSAEVIDTGSDGRFVVTTEGSERLRVDSSGRLGIGTSTVNFGAIDHGVHIYGSGAQEGIRLETTNGSSGILEIYAESGGNTLDTRGSGYIRFNNAATEWGRWDSSGRLLVGTSSARSNLYANAAPYTPPIQFEGNTNTWGNGASIINYSASGYGATLALGLSLSNTRGTNALVGAGETCGRLQFLANDGTNFYPVAEINGWTDTSTGVGDVPGRLTFSTTADGASSPTERMRISANGETTFSATVNTILGLKIGEASGWAGNPAIHTSSNVGYIIIRNGTSGGVGLSGGGTSWSSLSDENYKTDLTPITDAATKVRSLRTVTGRYTDDNEATSRSFLIAQDVEAVLPQAVSTADSGQKLLSYTDTIPLLTAALKEALEKIETLEAKVAALESA